MPYNFRCEIDYDDFLAAIMPLSAAFINIFDNNCCRRLTSILSKDFSNRVAENIELYHCESVPILGLIPGLITGSQD